MSSFNEYYHAGAKGHLVGIGGVSMSPLAEVLRGAGLVVTGSDMNEGDNVRHLRELGIPVDPATYTVSDAVRQLLLLKGGKADA